MHLKHGSYLNNHSAWICGSLLASWSVSVPAALGLLAKGEGLKGVALVVMHWVVLIFVDIDIYQSEIQVVHPYIVGLSVIGGMSVWDHALEGAVLGPLLVTALADVTRLFTGRRQLVHLVNDHLADGAGDAGRDAAAAPGDAVVVLDPGAVALGLDDHDVVARDELGDAAADGDHVLRGLEA